MSISGSLGFVTELLKDIIYPEICPICGDIIPAAKRAAYHKDKYDLSACYSGLVCDSCLARLNFVTKPYCSKCGKPLSEASSELCSDCLTHARGFVQCRALLRYDECMRDIMADIKYNGKREYLKLFGLLAADRLKVWLTETNINCLIPVPIHESRLIKRGYNQSELLCMHISELTCIPVRRDIIIREKKTAAQKELTADERLLNLQNAFKPVKKLPQGTTALIVDDIYTTGSTMEACTECLKAAGARAVYGLTICIGEDKGTKNKTEVTHHGIQKRHRDSSGMHAV